MQHEACPLDVLGNGRGMDGGLNGGASVDRAGTCCTLLGILVFFLMRCWHIHLHLLQRKSLFDGVLPVSLAIKSSPTSAYMGAESMARRE